MNKKFMTTMTLVRTVCITSLLAFTFSCDNSSSDDQSSEYSDKIESVTLLKTQKSWDGALYDKYPDGQPEITVLKIAVPPNKALDWHKHPVINAAYVEKGEIQVERQDNGETQWFRQGQIVPEMLNVPHRGKTGEKGATLIVFYSGTPDLAITELVL